MLNLLWETPAKLCVDFLQKCNFYFFLFREKQRQQRKREAEMELGWEGLRRCEAWAGAEQRDGTQAEKPQRHERCRSKDNGLVASVAPWAQGGGAQYVCGEVNQRHNAHCFNSRHMFHPNIVNLILFALMFRNKTKLLKMSKGRKYRLW